MSETEPSGGDRLGVGGGPSLPPLGDCELKVHERKKMKLKSQQKIERKRNEKTKLTVHSVGMEGN